MYRTIGCIGFGFLCAAGCGTEQPAARQGPLLTRLDNEPAGSHCPSGGKVYRAGHDSNGDGVLQDSEAERTDFVCNVAPAVLVRKDSLAASLECPAGGVAVQTGIDDNGDGVLQDGEIDQTARLCNSLELFDGNFAADDWNDPIKVAAIKGARVVTGSLAARGELPMLELVTGDLNVRGSFALPALRLVSGSLDVLEDVAASPTLPMLAEVDGNVFAANGLHALALPALQKIGGSLVASPGLEALSLPVLTTVRGDVRVREAGNLLDVPMLRTVGGALVLGPTVLGGAISLPVQTVGGALQVTGVVTGLTLNQLVSIGGGILLDSAIGASYSLTMPLLETITGDVTTPDLEAGLRLIELPKLTRLDGDLHLDSAVELTRISLPVATEITGEIVLGQPAKLTAIELGALKTSGAINISRATKLTTLSAPRLATVRAPRDGLSAGIRLQLTNLETVELAALRTAERGVRFESNAALRTVRLPLLESAMQLFVSECAIDTLSAPRLVSAGIVQLISAQIHTLDLGQLTTAASVDFLASALDDLAGLRSLSQVNLLSLNNVNGVKNFTDLASLRAVRSLGLDNNSDLTSLDGLDQLTDLPGRLDLVANPALESVAGLRNVRHVGDDVVLRDNATLPSIGLSSLQQIDGDLTIAGLAAVTDLVGLDHLTTVSGNIDIHDNAQLPAAVIQAFLARLEH